MQYFRTSWRFKAIGSDVDVLSGESPVDSIIQLMNFIKIPNYHLSSAKHALKVKYLTNIKITIGGSYLRCHRI